MFFGIIRSYFLPSANGVGPGGNLAAAAFVSTVAAAICFSVSGCCVLGPLPGIGTSQTNCCCVESEAQRIPPGLNLKDVAVTAGNPKPVVGNVV